MNESDCNMNMSNSVENTQTNTQSTMDSKKKKYPKVVRDSYSDGSVSGDFIPVITKKEQKDNVLTEEEEQLLKYLEAFYESSYIRLNWDVVLKLRRIKEVGRKEYEKEKQETEKRLRKEEEKAQEARRKSIEEEQQRFNLLSIQEQKNTQILKDNYSYYNKRATQKILKPILKEMKGHRAFYEYNMILLDHMSKHRAYKKIIQDMMMKQKKDQIKETLKYILNIKRE